MSETTTGVDTARARARYGGPADAQPGSINATVTALCDEVEQLRAQVDRVRALADTYDRYGRESIAESLRVALDGPELDD